MPVFTHEQDMMIAQFFQSVGPAALSMNDLPHNERQITERYEFLLANRADIFAQVLREEQMFEAIMDHDLTQSMVSALIEIASGSNVLGRGKGMSVNGLRSRGLVGPNRLKYTLTPLGADVAALFQGVSPQ